ncbi:hypothetical protein [Teredinibacter purpureus]|uniref:hypothetical protein n=1 Tax=Teredinibacter purpureus TaxID=2731756 RepID=UPI0005F80AC2|nr:hypothetical protein [Teredinibacter purpureus]
MSANKPTSVSVIAWFYMISGSLSILSAFAYLYVHFTRPEISSGAFIGVAQILIATLLVVAGKLFLNGSEVMRKVLELSTYALAVGLLFFSITTWLKSNDPSVLAMVALYLTPLFFISRALRSDKVKNYMGA